MIPSTQPTTAARTLSLPPPFCPPDCPPPAIQQLRHAFIQRNAPVLLQPTIDITHGNGLLCAFYHFTADDATCILSLVFEGEASWEVHRPTAVNHFGSFLYRTHNYRTYCRTADINHLAYHACNIHQTGIGVCTPLPEWSVLHTTDFSGLQSWSKGSKARFLYFYSLMHHFDLEMRRERWRQWDNGWTSEQQQQMLEQWQCIDLHHTTTNTSVHDRLQLIRPPTTPNLPQPTSAHYRPVVYINSGNHLMSPFNTNASTFPPSAYTVHHAYPLFPGDRSVAERFGQLVVRRKATLWSIVPSWLYVPGGGKMEAERRVWQRQHHSVLLEGRAEVARRAEVEGADEVERKDKLSVGDGRGHVMAVVEGMDNTALVEKDAETM